MRSLVGPQGIATGPQVVVNPRALGQQLGGLGQRHPGFVDALFFSQQPPRTTFSSTASTTPSAKQP